MPSCIEHWESFITLGPDCEKAQADLSLHWEQMPACTFCWILAQINRESYISAHVLLNL